MKVKLNQYWTGRTKDGDVKPFHAGIYSIEELGKRNVDMLVSHGAAQYVEGIEYKDDDTAPAKRGRRKNYGDGEQ